MRTVIVAFVFAASSVIAAAPVWTPQTSGVTARLRGVSAVNDRIVWTSGAGGTILRTDDGGEHWTRLLIPGTETLDFRDIDAVGDGAAYVLSIGSGSASRIYKTMDAGVTWRLQFTNTDEKAFYDAMAFWEARRGVAFSDSVDSRFVMLLTSNGGETWTPVDQQGLPPALPGEGAYAASGTNVAVTGVNDVWIATTAGRVLHSADAGRSWTVATTPVATGASAGLFSVAFRDARNGVVVGGDYRQEGAALENAARTTDGGRTWTRIVGLSGFRSVVRYVPAITPPALIAVGPSGADYSQDDAATWRAVDGAGFDAFSFAPSGRVGWGVGAGGRIARLQW